MNHKRQPKEEMDKTSTSSVPNSNSFKMVCTQLATNSTPPASQWKLSTPKKPPEPRLRCSPKEQSRELLMKTTDFWNSKESKPRLLLSKNKLKSWLKILP